MAKSVQYEISTPVSPKQSCNFLKRYLRRNGGNEWGQKAVSSDGQGKTLEEATYLYRGAILRFRPTAKGKFILRASPLKPDCDLGTVIKDLDSALAKQPRDINTDSGVRA